MGSPINNRALFPCQEPPIALSTWQASVRTAADFVVLMSGENSAEPVQLQEGEIHFSRQIIFHTFIIRNQPW